MPVWFWRSTISPCYRSFRKAPFTAQHKWTHGTCILHWEPVQCAYIPKSISETPLAWHRWTPPCHLESIMVIFSWLPSLIHSPLFSVQSCAPAEWLVVDGITEGLSQLASAQGKPCGRSEVGEEPGQIGLPSFPLSISVQCLRIAVSLQS